VSGYFSDYAHKFEIMVSTRLAKPQWLNAGVEKL